MSAKQVPVLLTDDLREKLMAVAEERKVSAAEILRLALRQYLAEVPAPDFSAHLFATLRNPVHWQTFCAIVAQWTQPDGTLPAVAPAEPVRATQWRYKAPEGAPRRAAPLPAAAADEEPPF